MEALGGDDFLKGTDDSETIDGGAGNDDIRAGYGNDTITGGAGQDEIQADREGRCNEMHCDLSPGSAADVIDAVDGEIDTIACGPGNGRRQASTPSTSSPPTARRSTRASRRPGEPSSRARSSRRAPGAATVAVAGSASLKALRKGKLRVAVAGLRPGRRRQGLRAQGHEDRRQRVGPRRTPPASPPSR